MRFLVALALAANLFTAPTLTYDVSKHQPFVVTSIPADATFVEVEFASLDQPGYTPSKAMNFKKGTLASYEVDWSMINCGIDDILADPHVTCPDDKEWDVRAFTLTDDLQKTVSNTVRVRYAR
jgi:hypothetical protein